VVNYFAFCIASEGLSYDDERRDLLAIAKFLFNKDQRLLSVSVTCKNVAW